MFSSRIISSGRFLKMPQTSQALYFHLCMNADDDGVVEAYKIIRMGGFGEDDLKVLAAKIFVKVLNEDLVSLVLDWNEHNLIRADRKVDSIYKELLVQIVPEIKLIEPKARADTGKPTGKSPMDSQWTANGRPMDSQWTVNGPHRLGKDRIGKDRIGKRREYKYSADAEKKLRWGDFKKKPNKSNPDVNEGIALLRKLKGTTLTNETKERYTCLRLINHHGKEKAFKMLEIGFTVRREQYAPSITGWISLERKWTDLETFLLRVPKQKGGVYDATTK